MKFKKKELAIALFISMSMVLSSCAGKAPAPAAETKTVAETPAAEPKAEEPKAEEPKAEEPKTEEAAAPAADPSGEDKQFGKYETPITMTIAKSADPTVEYKDGDTVDKNRHRDYIKEHLNIDVTNAWTAAKGQDFEQKVNLSIASNDLPDAMVVNAAQFRRMAKSDQIADMTDVIDQYASPTFKGFWEKGGVAVSKTVTFNDRIMGVPGIAVLADGFHSMWIRKDWLDKLGLEVPKSMADLENVAKQFVEKDPDGNGQNDTIGIAGPDANGKISANFLEPNSNTFGFDPIFGSFQSYPGYWINDKDGNVTYGSIQPETKQALAALADLYAKGLIDKEISVRKDASEVVTSGKAGMYFGPWWNGYWPLPDAVKNTPDANWQAYQAPLAVDGKYYAHQGTPSQNFVAVKKSYANPEAAMKIINLLIRDEKLWDVSKLGAGEYPLFMAYDNIDEIEFSYDAINKYLKGEMKIDDIDFTTHKLLKGDLDTIKTVKKEPYDNWDYSTWDKAANEGAWSRSYSIMIGGRPMSQPHVEVPSLLYSQTKTMETRLANLKKLESETFLKIIMGVQPIDTFDKFVTDWKAQGGDIITQEVADEIK